MVEYFVLNDDNKRDPNELFKELAEKCKEEKLKNQREEELKNQKGEKTAPSES